MDYKKKYIKYKNKYLELKGDAGLVETLCQDSDDCEENEYLPK